MMRFPPWCFSIFWCASSFSCHQRTEIFRAAFRKVATRCKIAFLRMQYTARSLIRFTSWKRTWDGWIINKSCEIHVRCIIVRFCYCRFTFNWVADQGKSAPHRRTGLLSRDKLYFYLAFARKILIHVHPHTGARDVLEEELLDLPTPAIRNEPFFMLMLFNPLLDRMDGC